MPVERRRRRGYAPSYSEGARRLWIWLARNNLSIQAFSERMGIAGGRVNRWLYGDFRPSIRWATELEQACGIDCHLWMRPPVSDVFPPELPKRSAA